MASAATGSEKHLPIGEILMSMGLLTEAQLQQALKAQREKGGAIGRILSEELKVVKPEDVMRALGLQAGMEVVNLDEISIPRAVLDKITVSIANMYRIVPVRFEKGILTVAMADPRNVAALDDLKFMTSCEVKGAVSSEEAVKKAIEKNYAGQEESIENLMKEFESPDGNVEVEEGGTGKSIDLADLQQMAESVPVIKLLNLYLIQAIKAQASDLHFEPFEDDYKVRMRIDGALYEMMPPPRHLAVALASRIKVMANMNIAERRLPQDSRIELNVAGAPIDLRVSTLPTKFGESVVLRVLDRRVIDLDLNKVGLREDDIKTFRELMHRPHGIVLVTGPTGSGKTTTLYSALNEMNSIDAKILTAEDPVEYNLDGIVQIPVNPAIGVTFARCLRAFLRQDPDVILIGEIRDLETAQMAIQAALTGHLVFSTLHTNDAPQTITRLVDMGVESFLLAAVLEGIVAQRLVRTICRECRIEYEPPPEVIMELGILPEQIQGKKLYTGKGCQACNNTGLRGRMALYEIMHISDRVREQIINGSSTGVLRDTAREGGMRTLRDSGLLAIYDGRTTIEEVAKATNMAE